MMRTALIATAVLALLTACTGSGVLPILGSPGGSPSPTCVNGWSTPAPGTALRTDALELIRTSLDLGSGGDRFIVDEIRYFTGPEDTDIRAPRRDVERWYVKAHLRADPSVAGRWIVRRADVGSGVASHAPYDSRGYESGLWKGEEEQCGFFDPPCLAAHGPYCACDWGVSGCSCADSSNPTCSGPPPEVMGCLDGT